MTCNIERFACIDIPLDVQQWLCPHLNFSVANTAGQSSPFETFSEQAWGQDWGDWDTQEQSDSKPEAVKDASDENSTNKSVQQGNGNEESWLSECLVSVSPTGDVVAVARESRLCIFTGVWEVPEDEEERLVLKLAWKGILEKKVGNITSVLCIPVSSLQRSSAGAPDFTSLLVCHELGPVRWYTLEGVLLLHKEFELPGVCAIEAELRSADADYLALLFPRSIVTIDVAQMTILLRMCVNKLAKASAAGEALTSSQSSLLAFKKWQLQGSGTVRGMGICGASEKDNVYDAMLHASLTQGSYTKGITLAGMKPSGVRMATTGEEPYVGMLSAKEMRATVHVTDVAKQLASAVTSKVLGAASAWIPFVGTKSTDEKVAEKIEPGIPTPYKWCLPDGPRTGLTVTVSPDPRLAAVTDNFGRVVLVDLMSGYALRVWKGYRDAVVGWVSVEGSCNVGVGIPEVQRRVLFLVIQAPRRGLLEVWPAQHGSRVAAFNIPKNAKLLYKNYGMLGGNVPINTRLYYLLLLHPDGTLHQLSVPFHLMLGTKTGKRSRDLHLYKSFKSAVKRGNEEDAAELVRQMQTTAVRLQVLAFLAFSPCMFSDFLLGKVLALLYPLYIGVELEEANASAASSVSGTPEPQSSRPSSCDPDQPPATHDCAKDKDAPRVQELLQKLRQLLQLHRMLCTMHPEEPKPEAAVGDQHDKIMKELSLRLALPESQIDELLQMSSAPRTPSSKVNFNVTASTQPRVNIAWFLKCFDLGVTKAKEEVQINPAKLMFLDSLKRNPMDVASKQVRLYRPRSAKKETSPSEVQLHSISSVELQEKLSQDRRSMLGKFMFGWRWSAERASMFHKAVTASGVNTLSLVKILFIYWQCEDVDTTARSNTVTPTEGTAEETDKADAPKQQTTVTDRTSKVTALLKMTVMLSSLISGREGEMQRLIDDKCEFWHLLRVRLANCPRLMKAYFMGLAAKAINTKLEARRERLEAKLKQIMEEEIKLTRSEQQDGDDTDMHVVEDKSYEHVEPLVTYIEVIDDNARVPPARSNSEILQLLDSDLFNEFNKDIERSLESEDPNISMEWDGCSYEVTHWAVVLQQFERVLHLERLLNLKLTRSGAVIADVTIKLLIDKGKGGVAEVVSRWLAKSGFTATELKLLTDHLDKQIQHRKHLLLVQEFGSDAVKEEMEDEDAAPKEEIPLLLPKDAIDWHPDLVAVYDCLLSLSESFPESLGSDSLRSNLTWELGASWQHSLHETELLTRAATVAATISNSHVKHGVCTLMWEKWISGPFRRLSELMARSTNAPSPSQCQSKLHIPRHNLGEFLKAVKSILTLVMESNVKCEVEKAHVPNVDPFWQHTVVEITEKERRKAYERQREKEEEEKHMDEDQLLSLHDDSKPTSSIYDDTNVQPAYHTRRFIDPKGEGRKDAMADKKRMLGPKSLVEVAVLQRVTSYDLAFIHTQLCDTLSVIAAHDIKQVKPYTFFNDRCRAVFHKSLHVQWTLGSIDEASTITSQRLRFLTSAITHAIAALPDSPSRQEMLDSGISDIIELGRVWGISTDHLYRFQVIELYSFGHDIYARDGIRLVGQTKQLSQNLLLLAGCRYKYLLDTHKEIGRLRASVDSSTGLWLNTLDAGQLRNPQTTPQQNIELMQTVINLLPSNSPDEIKAKNLLFAFQTFEERY